MKETDPAKASKRHEELKKNKSKSMQTTEDKPKNLFLQSMFKTFGITLIAFFATLLLIFIIAVLRG